MKTKKEIKIKAFRLVERENGCYDVFFTHNGEELKIGIVSTPTLANILGNSIDDYGMVIALWKGAKMVKEKRAEYAK